MDYRSLREKAEYLGRKARRMIELRKYKLGGPTQGEVSKSCEEAGDAWDNKELRVHREALTNAITYYKLAKENAYSEKVRERIKEKINGLRQTAGKGLERKTLFATSAIISFVSALFFISLNLTGYVVETEVLTSNNSNWISTGLFVLGLVFAFLYFRKR